MGRRFSGIAVLTLGVTAFLTAPLARSQERPGGGTEGQEPTESDSTPPRANEEPPTGANEVGDREATRGSVEGSGRSVRSVDEALAMVREQYPDLVSGALGIDELSSLLFEGTLNESGFTDPARLARVRLLIAEIDEAIGERTAARSLWKQVVDAAPNPELRARGLFELGFHYFLRERYRDAWRYWKPARDLAPDLPELVTVERYRPFLVMLETGDVPDFSGRFGSLGEKSLSDFRGKWVVIHFWTTQVAGAYQDAELLKATVNSVRNEGWQGVVLGVNLDGRRESFEAAVREWTVDFRPADGGPLIQVPALDWPQHHDGLGFQSPIVRTLALPRAPVVLLVDPAGKLRHVTEIKPVETANGKKRYRYQDSRVLRYTLLEGLDRSEGAGDDSAK